MAILEKLDKINDPWSAMTVTVYILTMAFLVCFGTIYDNQLLVGIGAATLSIPANSIFMRIWGRLTGPQHVSFPVLQKDLGAQEKV